MFHRDMLAFKRKCIWTATCRLHDHVCVVVGAEWFEEEGEPEVDIAPSTILICSAAPLNGHTDTVGELFLFPFYR